VGTWLIFTDGGLAVERGKPKEVFANPQTERLQQFLAKVL
jgi:polar amino acid transport system ATP-binding protein